MVIPKDPFDVGTRAPVKEFARTARGLGTLFDLGDLEQSLLITIDDAEESGEDPIHALEQLADVQTALAQKTEGYVSIIRQLQHLRDARKTEADRLRQRAASADRAIDWLLNNLKVYMQTSGNERIETGRFSLSLRTNPPRVEVLEEAAVPPQFVRTVVTTAVDKRSILDHLKATGEVPDGVSIVRDQRVAIS